MDFDHPPPDPLPVFLEWLEAASKTDLPNPNAMTLATVDPDGRPSSRIMLLKGIDERGAVFFTNRLGRKGKALAAHPYAAIGFHWDVLDRQVRIEGPVTIIADAESDEYFATRPRPSQIGAWASRQSEPVAGRAELDAAFAQIAAQYEGRPIPRPPHWGGYRLTPERWEFWQGQAARLHDRVVYIADGKGGWTRTRLFP